jgi:hypothetical protein
MKIDKETFKKVAPWNRYRFVTDCVDENYFGEIAERPEISEAGRASLASDDRPRIRRITLDEDERQKIKKRIWDDPDAVRRMGYEEMTLEEFEERTSKATPVKVNDIEELIKERNEARQQAQMFREQWWLMAISRAPGRAEWLSNHKFPWEKNDTSND